MSVMGTLQNWGEPQKPDGVKFAISWAKKKGMAIPKEFVKVPTPPHPPTHPRRPMSMLPMCRDSGVAAESRGVVAAALCPRGTMAKRRLAHTLVGSLALYRLLIPSSFKVEPAAGASESSPGDSAAVAAAGVQAAAAAMATVKAELV